MILHSDTLALPPTPFPQANERMATLAEGCLAATVGEMNRANLCLCCCVFAHVIVRSQKSLDDLVGAHEEPQVPKARSIECASLMVFL